MFNRAPLIIFITSAFLMAGTWLHGDAFGVDSLGKQATGVSQKRFEQKSWSGGQQSDLMKKSFPFKQYDSHYSALGSKRSNISMKETKDKERFKAEMMEFPEKKMDISKWNGRLAQLEDQAQISTGTTSKQIEDKRMYESMMQTSKNYAETGKILSLRDVNRFQFRQNRSSSAVPVTAAGVSPDS
ncbi:MULTISPECIES: hypothetical protein [unclassified Lentimonas]|uniref:hypothetical protein n=1 Tax=unclassified Lentimonas TaxID=2630993 RepID=UPI001324A74D|nr:MULTISPECIES: hypothetical protein [unclassified Lentimonas]CAA6690585.1 Unannotated [Lentimonas sp. CC10]CAA6695302.1 Unannotated [Lentimonas sp. CC19]CAA7068841.1 Unannotated [Lentimonas sp. CC11]